MDAFQTLREFLFNENHDVDLNSISNPFYKRILNAFIGTPSSFGKSDRAVLLRSILRYESEQQQGKPVMLKVPKGDLWPNQNDWQSFGVQVIDEHQDGYMVEAYSWQPNWLGGGEISVDTPLFHEEKRNNLEPTLADPFLKIVDRTNYRSRGQRDAIRSILTAPKGATIVVNLPTGSGKSLCAQLPALLQQRNSGLTIVVVPTVALALDQERAMSEYVVYPTAYIGDPKRKAENEEIRLRIMEGSQTIVFAPPESLLQSLHLPLQIATERGYLRYFVIDEAHMVSGWGDEFRPAFQELAGLRIHLLEKSKEPFQTLLLSATITEQCLDTLETLYGDPGPFRMFATVQLRPEPSYWVQQCWNEEVRTARLLEAVSMLPRPLIIYTTKVADANHLYGFLRENGFLRTGLMTGDTKKDVREQLLKDWQKGKVDLVVATSAFGLGVDQSKVRAVIHACIPETLDRFYQEVGRGGRDGRACLSLLLYTEEDKRAAEGLNRKIIIGIERGIQRWRQMFHHKVAIPNKPMQYKVPINIVPSYEDKDIDMNNEKNKAWNIRTLLLMSKAGLIKLLWEERNQDQEYTGESYRVIQIIDQDHLQKNRWDEMIQPFRRYISETDSNSLQLMKTFLDQQCCSSDVFSRLYRISQRKDGTYREGANVLKACGGCKFCRSLKRSFPSTARNTSRPVNWAIEPDLTEWFEKRYFINKNTFIIFYPQSLSTDWTSLNVRQQQSWKDLFRFLVDQGVQNIVGEKELLDFLLNEDRLFNKKIVFMSQIDQIASFVDLPNIPTIVFHSPTKKLNRLTEKIVERNEDEEQKIIVFLPDDILEPDDKGRTLREITHLPHYGLEEFLTGVGQ